MHDPHGLKVARLNLIDWHEFLREQLKPSFSPLFLSERKLLHFKHYLNSFPELPIHFSAEFWRIPRRTASTWSRRNAGWIRWKSTRTQFGELWILFETNFSLVYVSPSFVAQNRNRVPPGRSYMEGSKCRITFWRIVWAAYCLPFVCVLRGRQDWMKWTTEGCKTRILARRRGPMILPMVDASYNTELAVNSAIRRCVSWNWNSWLRRASLIFNNRGLPADMLAVSIFDYLIEMK